MAAYSVIGKSKIRKDAVEKVTGAGIYTADIHPKGMLYAKLLGSTVAHGIIKRIDISKAEALPGVIAVLTGKDVPEERSDGYMHDRHILCKQKTRYVGDPVAAVAATSEAIAEKALKLIELEYEELAVVFDPVEALTKDCKAVLHEDMKNYFRVPMVCGDFVFDDERPNQFTCRTILKGDVEKGFEEADVLTEHTYTLPRASHCYMEPDSCLVIPGKNGHLTVYASDQVGAPGKYTICYELQMDSSKIRFIVPYLGGGFGGKTGIPITLVTVLLAIKANRPVRLVHTRNEVFVSGNPRSSAVITVKDGYKKDGTLVAREIIEYVNGGAYSAHVTALICCGIYGSTGSYKIPNLKHKCYGVYTNCAPTGPYRSLGSEIICFAVERNMEYAAKELGIDSTELRMKNLLVDGDIDGTSMVSFNNSAKEAFCKAVEFIELGKKRPPEGPWVYGKGVSVANKFGMLTTGFGTEVTVKINDDGTIEVRTFHIEMGQGATTVDAQVAAEEFRLSFDRVNMVVCDSLISPFDEGTFSSKGSYVFGNAIIKACKAAKKRLFELASIIMEISADKLDTADGFVFEKENPENRRHFGELFEWSGFCRFGGEVIGTDTWNPYFGEEDVETGQGNLVMFYSHGSWGIEVAVNRETGEVRIEKAGGWYDGAQILNHMAAQGQIEGAFSMGLGQALYEEILVNDKGKVTNGNFRDYKIPTFMDMPPNDKVSYNFIEKPLETGPYGAKGIGEIALIPVLPAIANAINDALGADINELPLTRERVLAAIKVTETKAGVSQIHTDSSGLALSLLEGLYVYKRY